MQNTTACFLLLSGAITWQAVAQSPSNSDSQVSKKKIRQVVLTRRGNNGPYGTTAYSFRHQTQELDVHRNNVDVVFNGCGQLHINLHAGLQGRIADLGKVDMDKITLVAARKVPRQSWRRFCLLPMDGHVYLHEGRYLNQQFTVAFKIKVIRPDKLGMQWRFIGVQEGEDAKYRYVGAGTMGQCGGAHGER